MMTANLVTKTGDYLTEDLVINSDDNFGSVVKLAQKQAQPVCIEWRRSTDGQIAYWTPSGASLGPHYYNA